MTTTTPTTAPAPSADLPKDKGNQLPAPSGNVTPGAPRFPATSVRDYAAWFQRHDARLSPQDQAVGAFLARHRKSLDWRLRLLRVGREDALQVVMLEVVEGVREALAAGVELAGPLGQAWEERILRRTGAGQGRQARSSAQWRRRAVAPAREAA